MPELSRSPSPTSTANSHVNDNVPNRGTGERDLEKQVGPHEPASPPTTTPTASGPSASLTEKQDSEFVVKWDGPDDPGCPLNTPTWKKWYVLYTTPADCKGALTAGRSMTIVLAVSCACVTCCSSMAGSTYAGMEAEFGVSREVCVLSISLFVIGLGVGPR
jgi:hypothetical protein